MASEKARGPEDESIDETPRERERERDRFQPEAIVRLRLAPTLFFKMSGSAADLKVRMPGAFIPCGTLTPEFLAESWRSGQPRRRCTIWSRASVFSVASRCFALDAELDWGPYPHMKATLAEDTRQASAAADEHRRELAGQRHMCSAAAAAQRKELADLVRQSAAAAAVQRTELADLMRQSAAAAAAQRTECSAAVAAQRSECSAAAAAQSTELADLMRQCSSAAAEQHRELMDHIGQNPVALREHGLLLQALETKVGACQYSWALWWTTLSWHRLCT